MILFAVFIQIIMMAILHLRSNGSLSLPILGFVLASLVLVVVAYFQLLIWGSHVHRGAIKLKQSWSKYLRKVTIKSWEVRKIIRALPILKIHFGYSNFFDRLTPVVVANLLVNNLISVLIMMDSS